MTKKPSAPAPKEKKIVMKSKNIEKAVFNYLVSSTYVTYWNSNKISKRRLAREIANLRILCRLQKHLDFITTVKEGSNEK